MKTKLFTTFIFLFFNYLISAQGPPQSGYKINFNYDASGNQTLRYFAANKATVKKEKVATTETEGFIEETKERNAIVRYYPNPLDNELNVSWQESINTKVNVLQIYDLTGKLLRSLPLNNQQNTNTISFTGFSSGIYIVKVHFDNGKEENFKVIKK